MTTRQDVFDPADSVYCLLHVWTVGGKKAVSDITGGHAHSRVKPD